MATYENCYTILEDVRRGLNEYSTAFVQATDTTGAYSNEYLVRKICEAQRFLYALLFNRIPEEFYESTTLTGSSSVFTLPSNFGQILEFRDENGYKVYRINPRQGKSGSATGYDRLYYQKGRTFVVDKDGVSDTYTLMYYKKPRDLHQGKAAAGASTSITLASTAKAIADYYNGVTIENITKDWVDTIDDYTAARVATISETAAADDFYGTVPEIPEAFHSLIVPKAIMLAKSHPLSKTPATAGESSMFNDALIETLRAYCGTSQEGDIDDLFQDFHAPFSPGGWIDNA